MTSRILDRSALDSAKKGSADLLILALVDERDLHGYDIARRIEDRSAGTLHFTLASLYATLYRLEERGLIRGRWVERAGQRRRRYYRITDAGRTVLAEQREDWARFIAALAQVAGVRPA
jgi:transcriptional regulator